MARVTDARAAKDTRCAEVQESIHEMDQDEETYADFSVETEDVEVDQQDPRVESDAAVA